MTAIVIVTVMAKLAKKSGRTIPTSATVGYEHPAPREQAERNDSERISRPPVSAASTGMEPLLHVTLDMFSSMKILA